MHNTPVKSVRRKDFDIPEIRMYGLLCMNYEQSQARGGEKLKWVSYVLWRQVSR